MVDDDGEKEQDTDGKWNENNGAKKVVNVAKKNRQVKEMLRQQFIDEFRNHNETDPELLKHIDLIQQKMQHYFGIDMNTTDVHNDKDTVNNENKARKLQK